VDYSSVNPSWGVKHYPSAEFAALWLSEEHLGLKPLVTQHMLGQPYFTHVAADEIVVEWQQLVSHGRRDGDVLDASVPNIKETSDGRSWMRHRFVKVNGLWKITGITPLLSYHTGDWMRIRRPVGQE
jgi:scytalone dehydratase